MQRRDTLHAATALALAAAGLGAQAAGAAPAAPAPAPAPATAATPTAEVYKTPTCGCCGAWVDHLRAAGFTVRVHEVDDIAPVRSRLGMPAALASCHTARIGDYVVEGHVPATDIRRLLASNIVALGLAVPGMPIGSPGMEMGPRLDPYEVLLVERGGRTRVFSRYPRS
jgi:hypothetical protein